MEKYSPDNKNVEKNVEDIDDSSTKTNNKLRNGKVSISINGGKYVEYKSAAVASRAVGIHPRTISKHKNKSNVVHPAQIYQDGNVYDIRFEGYEDKNEFDDSYPRKIGRKLDLYLDGDELINYKGITDACEKTGIAASTLMYNYYKSFGSDEVKVTAPDGKVYYFKPQV